MGGFFAFEFALSQFLTRALFAFSTKKERKKERVRPDVRVLQRVKKKLVFGWSKRKKEKKRKEKEVSTTDDDDDDAQNRTRRRRRLFTPRRRRRERERERDKRRVRCQLHDHDSRNESSETRRDESRVREKATRLMSGERGVASGVDSRGRDRPRKERCIRATEAAEKEGILR